ncbi:pyridine nucleotide-disulfide oxidoreductase [Kosmotoga pacifica]|uniref:Pyridine nucleotide-disulfide oxidoreductase n=2 Tax=Kosmotoga pacifica TaxID=1330330 RepID=A0A0G2ZF92_9BACT|nr:pyridine nucleotide-disulfide oxidoreductase [Kosmotoga pacifica]
MAAALSASREGVMVTLLEREKKTGGVLNQCIHHGFGLQFYRQELTGPEFAHKLQLEMNQHSVNVISESYVRHIDTMRKYVEVLSPDGVFIIQARAIVLSTGARERPFGSLMIPGDRPAGIYTAGLAQRMVNLENTLPGRRALILGSGDIGLIMARRLTLEGMEVLGVVERLPYPGGLTRNVVQCLEDYGIPLHLSHTVVEVRGKKRLERVLLSKVDENFNIIPGTQRWLKIDTLILSAGLIPQVEDLGEGLETDPVNRGFAVSNSCETSVEGIFAAGNNVAVFDLVDYVAAEGWIAGKNAALHARGERRKSPGIPIVRGKNVGVLVPTFIDPSEHLRVYLRLRKPMDRGVVISKELDIETPFNYGTPSEMIQFVINRDKLQGLKKAVKIEVIE